MTTRAGFIPSSYTTARDTTADEIPGLEEQWREIAPKLEAANEICAT